MVKLPFSYPVRVSSQQDGQVRLSCRDLPELSLSLAVDTGLMNMLNAAEDAMDSVVNDYISKSRLLPSPSIRAPDEYILSPTAATIVRAFKHQGYDPGP